MRRGEPPICGGSREARKNLAFISDMDDCVCDRAEDLAGKLVDPGAQLAHLLQRNDGKELLAGCKEKEPERFFMTDAVGCYQLGYLNGFIKGSIKGLGGNGHDGDEHPELCPIGPDDQGVHNGREPIRFADREIDLRSGDTLAAEWQWCRWFGGPFAVAEDPTHEPPLSSVFWPEFRPQHGERVSVVGDWVIDGRSHAELHEIRFGATVRPHPGVPDVWHLLTSGFFARGSAQQDLLAMDVPVPRSSDPLKTTLRCDLVESTVTRCFNKGIEPPTVNADSERGVCEVRIRRMRGSAGEEALSERYCGDTHRTKGNGPDVQCPCFSWNGEVDEAGGTDHLDMVCAARGITDFSTIDRCTFDGFQKDAPGYIESHPEKVSRIAFAGDIRAEWTAPAGLRAAPASNLWSCNCACDDPSQPGATVLARVQGCSPIGIEADDGVNQAEVCAQVCGGEFCGARLRLPAGTVPRGQERQRAGAARRVGGVRGASSPDAGGPRR